MRAPEEPTDQQLIDQYFKLDKILDGMTEDFNKATAPYKSGMQAISAMLHDRLNQRGAKHTSVHGGTAFKVQTMSSKVTNRIEFFRFCFGDPDWGGSLLTSHVSNDTVKKFQEQYNGRNPPGVETTWIEKLQIRRVG